MTWIVIETYMWAHMKGVGLLNNWIQRYQLCNCSLHTHWVIALNVSCVPTVGYKTVMKSTILHRLVHVVALGNNIVLCPYSTQLSVPTDTVQHASYYWYLSDTDRVLADAVMNPKKKHRSAILSLMPIIIIIIISWAPFSMCWWYCALGFLTLWIFFFHTQNVVPMFLYMASGFCH